MISRYETKEIKNIFAEESKYKKWLLVERKVAQVLEEEGIIPRGLSKSLLKVKIEAERVREIEAITNHDVIAFLEAVREKIGKEGRWLHFGMTSYDLVDTALSLILLEAIKVVFNEIDKLLNVLKILKKKYYKTPQMGRTHGVSAQPITFGYKVASWAEEIKRARQRLEYATHEIGYGKLSGAVGSYTILSPRIESMVMGKLGLEPEPVSTQVIPRDRIAHLLSCLAIYGCGIERIATEIRNLSRSEVGEVAEPFSKGQKGSSAMPHKKNPITCERLCGLVRVLRSELIPAYENINLWHERDITNSSVERIILPDCFHIVHYITKKMVCILKNLQVSPERMMDNIKNSYGVYASQSLMNHLIKKGMSRADAYKLIQSLSFQAVKEKKDLKEIVLKDKTVTKYLDKAGIRKIFNLNWFLRNII
jgi:adenylosuccinate lyase